MHTAHFFSLKCQSMYGLNDYEKSKCESFLDCIYILHLKEWNFVIFKCLEFWPQKNVKKKKKKKRSISIIWNMALLYEFSCAVEYNNDIDGRIKTCWYTGTCTYVS